MRSTMIVTCILLVCSVLPVHAQSGRQPNKPGGQQPRDIGETIKMDVDLVVVDARVLNENTNKFIGGLTEDDFEIFEDGRKQQITHFSRDTSSLSVIILIDSWMPGVERIKLEKLGENMPTVLQHLQAEDEIALMLYTCDTIWLLQDFTRNKGQLAQSLTPGIWAGLLPTKAPLLTGFKGGLHRVVYEAASHLNARSVANYRKYVLAITTDFPNLVRRGNCDVGVFDASKRETLSKNEISRQVFRLRNTVSAVVVPTEYAAKARKIDKRGEKLLRIPSLLAAGYNSWEFGDLSFYIGKTGGDKLFATPDTVTDRLIEMFNHLYEHYSFGYTPSNRKRDGKFRQIKLKVKPSVEARNGKVVVVTREGYYAPLGNKTKSKPDKQRLR